MLRIEENDIQTEKMSQKLTEFTSSGTYPNLNDAVIKCEFPGCDGLGNTIEERKNHRSYVFQNNSIFFNFFFFIRKNQFLPKF
jgi:hypothetical protein